MDIAAHFQIHSGCSHVQELGESGKFLGGPGQAWSWGVGKIQRRRGKYHSQEAGSRHEWEGKCQETRVVSYWQLVSISDLSSPVSYHCPLSHYMLAMWPPCVPDTCQGVPCLKALHSLSPLLELHSSPFSLVSGWLSLRSPFKCHLLRDALIYTPFPSHFFSFISIIMTHNYLVYSLLLPDTAAPTPTSHQ